MSQFEDSTASPTAMSSDMGQAEDSTELQLMTLSMEVRSNIWKQFVEHDDPIDLEVLGSGLEFRVRDANPSGQSLTTSKAFCHQVLPILYSSNVFQITLADIPELLKLANPACKHMEHCIVSIEDYQGSEDEEKPDPLQLHIIGEAMPKLHTLELHPWDASAMLATVLKLTNNLPCSTVGDARPTLKVHIETRVRTDDDFDLDDPDELNDAYEAALKDAEFVLSAIPVNRSSLGFGKEMPDLKRILVKGQLSERLSELVKAHTGALGNCCFEEKVVSSEKKVYTWKRRGAEA